MDGEPAIKMRPGFLPVRAVLAVLLLPACSAPGQQDAVTFTSGERQVVMVELFTSQGCSSCPPAEKWVSGLAREKGLWTDFIPMTFHVDYWDRLGWPDPFGERAHTRRQYAYHRTGRLQSVYSPGMLAAGKEWRGWRGGGGVPTGSARPGLLSVRVGDGVLRTRFSRHGAGLELHVAVLGFGLETRVPRGENAGRTLRSDFVVLYHDRGEAVNGGWQTSWPPPRLPDAPRYALAVWVSRRDHPAPIQATGGWLVMAGAPGSAGTARSDGSAPR